MATRGKARLKKLLTKGLTGWEAGALLFREGLERQWGKQENLTESEIETIRNSLKTNESREAYNNFLDTAITVDRATFQAWGGGMVVVSHLLKVQLILKDCLWHWRMRQGRYYGPLLVTQSQYEELRDKHKKELLKKLWPLDEVIEWRMDIPLKITEEWEETEGDEKEIVFVKRQYPAVYRQALDEIASLIKEGKLHLVSKRGKPAKKFEGLSAQDLEAIQGEAYISGADLYGSGLPEWIKEIDAYEVPYRDVAIIQNPDPYHVDERGYYKDPDEETHNDPYGFRATNEILIKRKTSYTLVVQERIRTAKEGISRFLAFKSVIEDFYRLMGLKKFGGNIEACYQIIVSEVQSLNQTIEWLIPLRDLAEAQGIVKPQPLAEKGPVPLIDVSKLETIDITKIEPEAESLKMVRGWIAKEGIGDNWWKGAKLAPELEVAGEVEKEASLDG
jgi:hypothetical protein